MRVLLLLLVALLFTSSASARGVEVAQLDGDDVATDIAAVRAAAGARWVETDAMRYQSQPSWWRIRLAPGADDGSVWVLAIKEAYDAELVAYLPPDYRPQRLSTFDPTRRQIGSRHRLTLELPRATSDAPVFVRVLSGRHQPMRVSAAPLAEYMTEDLMRVRITSMILSALLLLGLVATIFAIALRRWRLLLFAVWVVSFVVYVLVMSGEVVSLVNQPWVLQHALGVSSVAIDIGSVAAYGFVVGFLDIPDHYPRLARVMNTILVLIALLLIVVIFDPHTAIFSPVINVGVILLAMMSLAAACARARAGSPQGWFFLLGWGSMTVVGIVRAGYFLQLKGTPDWLEILHPACQVFGALVLVLATARAARYAEREMHVARTVARIDPLTLLPNRAELDRGLDAMLRQAQQDGLPACVMFVDLDHFKSINDRFGHGVGDICLTAMGRILRHHVRASDLIARYGGEEFVLALEGAGRERAATVAEALRAAVQEQGRELAGHRVELTASIGVSDYRTGDRPADLLARADAALYRAKHEGRNRVVLDFAQGA